MHAQWSDPKHETPEAFVSNIHTLYAGTTGLFLQAAMAGVACKQWKEKSGIPTDYYGFQRTGLVAINNDPPRKATTETIKKWSETWGTPHLGKEGDLVACLIQQHIKNGQVDPQDLGFVPHKINDGWVVWRLP